MNNEPKKLEQHLVERLGEDPLRRSREEARVIRDSINYFDHAKSIRRTRRNPLPKNNKTVLTPENPPPSLQPEPLENRLYKFLTAHGEASLGEISKALQADRPTIRAALVALRKEGKVKVIDNDLFDLIAANLRKILSI